MRPVLAAPLLVVLIAVVSTAGCIVDPPQTIDPASLEPQPAPTDAPREETPKGPRADPAPDNSTPPPPPPAPSPTPAPAPAAPPAPPKPLYVVDLRWGNITAGAGASSPDGTVCCLGGAPADESARQTATLAAGVRAFVVELRWDGRAEAEAGFDLDLVVMAPDYRERDVAPPGGVPSEAPEARTYDGHRFAATSAEFPAPGVVRLLVDDPAVLALAGEWTVEVVPKGAAAQVPFQLALTSVFGMPPEEGYSAFA